MHMHSMEPSSTSNLPRYQAIYNTFRNRKQFILMATKRAGAWGIWSHLEKNEPWRPFTEFTIRHCKVNSHVSSSCPSSGTQVVGRWNMQRWSLGRCAGQWSPENKVEFDNKEVLGTWKKCGDGIEADSSAKRSSHSKQDPDKRVWLPHFCPLPALLSIDRIIIRAQLYNNLQWFMVLYNQHWINLSQSP